MASRLVKSVVGAGRLRPSLAPALRSTVPVLGSTYHQVRVASTTNPPPAAGGSQVAAATDPKSRAQSILDALPGDSLISKTAILSSAAGAAIWAISNEFYVVNEETVVAVCLLSVWGALIKYGGPLYTEWARGHSERILGVLNAARADHKQAVQTRLNDVRQMAGVVDVTRNLFAVSKETARLEAEAFALEQKTALAAEAKSVLDSWVRYEDKVKQRQQRELADSIMARVKKELENPKTLQQILQQSLTDVERIVASKAQ